MYQIDIKKGVLLTIFSLQVFSTVCSLPGLVGVFTLSFSSLCVRRCSLLEMLLLSGKKVHWDPLYRLTPRTGPPWCVLVVPARPGFPEMTHRSALLARASQPAPASSSAARPRTEAPKSPKWSPQLVMSTIPKRKHKRSDIEANYRNETKTFWCVPKKEIEHFYLVQKLWIKIIMFLCDPEPLKSKSERFYVV